MGSAVETEITTRKYGKRLRAEGINGQETYVHVSSYVRK